MSDALDVPCDACGAASRAVEYESSLLQVRRCRGCGHRGATHLGALTTADYHDQGLHSQRFLATLEVTRRRQARRIISRMLELRGSASCWLDFGCGRGFLLDEARKLALSSMAGFDTSVRAREWLEARGLGFARPSPAEPGWPDLGSLGFAPAIVSLLDVLEHLPGAEPARTLTRLVAELPSLEWLVIKVPSSTGVLYRLAHAMRSVTPALYLQLYQVGTSPPHFQYYHPGSLSSVLEKSGYLVQDVLADADVDNVFHRVPALERLPGGSMAARVLGAFPADSVIAFARVVRAAK